ncbi:MAG: hypothetical protein AUK35_10815 [Zetaproteobacteria bacterium CG2_30_46_52]|nr:MAG: hypothetical protein AUK35_10815 [Zetaproteobacteria bacterium CG2_30_46_52]
MTYVLRLVLFSIILVLMGCATSQISSYKYKLTKPDIGPMIGKTTSSGFRVWIKAHERDNQVYIRYRKMGGAGEFSDPDQIKISADYENVGVVDVLPEGAQPSDSYEYQVGYLKYPEVKKDCPSLSSECIDWKDAASGTVRLFPAAGASAATRFIFGSCRDFGIFSAMGENTFARIRELLAYEEKLMEDAKTDFIIQAGDQVYIDGNPLARLTENRYRATYKRSFAKKNFTSVMSKLPTYMMLDDHEITNDWSMGQFKYDKLGKDKLMAGQKFYEAYQASLNLGNNAAEALKPATYGDTCHKKYWYDFNHGQNRFFVLDTRSGNSITKDQKSGKDKSEPVVLGESQELAFKKWLCEGAKSSGVGEEKCISTDRADDNVVKFIVSPLPVFPDTLNPPDFVGAIDGDPDDKWGGAVEQRKRILDFIRLSKIKRVVFLSGDVHTSFIAELTHEQDKDFRIYNVVSSPFNWSTSFGVGLQKANFDFDFLPRELNRPPLSKWDNAYSNAIGKRRPCGENKGFYCVRRFAASQPKPDLIHTENNFSRITVIDGEVEVEFFKGRNGDLLEKTTLQF